MGIKSLNGAMIAAFSPTRHFQRLLVLHSVRPVRRGALNAIAWYEVQKPAWVEIYGNDTGSAVTVRNVNFKLVSGKG